MIKPPFRLPSMAEVAAARGTAGLTVVSTFSGCGGSCLGFEMAGYRVLWANEFVPAARDTYAANHPETILDGRDIRKVEPAQILDAIGMKPGELDVLNGSPPCASFSSAGKRSEHWGKVKSYSDTKQRTDDLFFEFVRLVKGLQPRAFVAENVAGLTRGVALGYFKEIMRALSACGYDVRCRVLDAQWLSVPQSRCRAIFIGVRNDLGLGPEYPKPLPYRYTLREVLPGLMRVQSLRSGFERTPEERLDRVAPAIMAIHDTGGQFSSGDVTNRPSPTVGAKGGHASMAFKVIERVVHDTSGLYGAGDITDRPCPTVSVGVNSVNSYHFKVHERAPSEARKFTMAELRIVCGFPADFVLTGTYGQQWERLGRAVPPPMMRAVAATLRDGLFTKLGRTRPGFTEAL